MSNVGTVSAREVAAIVSTTSVQFFFGPTGLKTGTVTATTPKGYKLRGTPIRFWIHGHTVSGGRPSEKQDHSTAARFARNGAVSIVVSKDGSIYLLGASSSEDRIIGATSILE
jgi:hypothetical protein